MSNTLEQVARLAGVSRSTVSRVINDHPNVHPDTRAQVWEAIRKSGYRPNVIARSLVTNRTQIIGMVIPEAVSTLFADPFFPLLLRSTTEACNAHGYQLLLSLFNAPYKDEEIYRRVVRNGYLDGMVVASAATDDPVVSKLLRDQLDFVSIGRHPDERVHYVDADNVGGARSAVEHLIRIGHRRIATITGRLDMVAGQDRFTGYRQALEARGIPFDEGLVFNGDFTEESGMTGMHKLLPGSPTAVFVANDGMAIGALKALRSVGRRVPDDVALVGFDDVPLASAIEPALTTVRQPIERLGTMAIKLLLGLIETTPDAGAPAHRIILPTQLVVRNSCGSV